MANQFLILISSSAMDAMIQDENYLTIHLLSNANTLVADGIHQVHFTGAGRSEGFGGNRRTEMNYKIHCTSVTEQRLIALLLPEEFCQQVHGILRA